MGRWLISIGLSLVLIGVLWQFGSRLGLGQLPGDISFKRGHTEFHLPLMSCLLVSLGLSLAMWLLGKFR